jgi:hypothetical protein
MPNQIPLINGKAYSWASVTVQLAGAVLVGITAIMYDDGTEKENGYGAGQMPIDRGEGNYKADASITIRAAEDEALIAKSPTGRLQDLGVFDIIVQYLVGTVKKKHIIRNCEFLGNKRDLKQGDKIIDVEHALIVSHVEWK